MNIDKTIFERPVPRYIRAVNLTQEIWDKQVATLKSIIREHEPRFEYTEELAAIHKNMLLYFLGNSRSEYDLNKGLYVYGDPGCGKSLLMQYVFKQFTAVLGVNSYRVAQSIDIVRKTQKNGLLSIQEYVKADNKNPIVLLIDDFGAGNRKVNNYGTTVDVFSELVVNRYPYFSKHGIVTHFTSNIQPADFKKEFDDRVSSRMAEMVNTVYLPKKDYRREK
jgi:DNA replication protein DnaC